MRFLKNFLYKVPQLILLAAVVTIVVVRSQSTPALSPDHEYKDASAITIYQVQKLYPNAASFDYKREEDAFSPVYDETNTLLGYFLSSTPYADDISGHGGPVPLLIGIDTGGKISNVVVLPNAETGGFIDVIRKQGVLDAWNGLSIDEAVEKEVDTISGATMSSSAIIQSFRKRLFFFLNKG